tara:strand:+ start:541 stop:810 length:270 start_codon:yes stop_codon:yes gene_type:complete
LVVVVVLVVDFWNDFDIVKLDALVVVQQDVVVDAVVGNNLRVVGVVAIPIVAVMRCVQVVEIDLNEEFVHIHHKANILLLLIVPAIRRE